MTGAGDGGSHTPEHSDIRRAEDGAVQPTVDEIDREVERWADSDGEVTLARWLMDAFGWDQAKADEIVERYPDG